MRASGDSGYSGFAFEMEAAPCRREPAFQPVSPSAQRPGISVQHAIPAAPQPRQTTANSAPPLVRSGQDLKATYWKRLTSAQQEECVGEHLTQSYLGRHAWETSGYLRDFWHGQVLSMLKVICNSKEGCATIYGRRRHHEIFKLELLLLNTADDPRGAKPTILVTCHDKKIAKNSIQVMQKHSDVKELGFEFMALEEKIMLLAGIAGREPASDVLGSHSLCGSRIVVSPWPVNLEQYKQATFGGVVFLSNRHYVLTAAHTFYPDFETNGSDEGSEDGSIDPSSEDQGSCSSENEEDSSLSGHEGEFSQLFPQKHGVYLQAAPPAPSSDATPTRSLSSQSSMSALVGHLTPSIEGLTSESEARTLISRRICLDYDWALVKIQDSRFVQRNIITISPTERKEVLIDSKPIIPEGEVIIAGGGSGISRGIVGTICGMTFPWSKKVQNVWSVNCTTAPGDSGAWVVSAKTGTLFGMLVAACKNAKQAYMIQATDILKSIRERWDGVIPENADLSPLDPARNTRRPAEIKVSPSSSKIVPPVTGDGEQDKAPSTPVLESAEGLGSTELTSSSRRRQPSKRIIELDDEERSTKSASPVGARKVHKVVLDSRTSVGHAEQGTSHSLRARSPVEWRSPTQSSPSTQYADRGGSANYSLGFHRAPSTARPAGSLMSQDAMSNDPRQQSATAPETKLNSCLSSLAQSFTQIVPGDFLACQKFINEHPSILSEDSNSILREALLLYNSSQHNLARSYIQSAYLINKCSTMTRNGRQEYFSDLRGKVRSALSTFWEDLQKIENWLRDQAQQPQSSQTYDTNTQPAKATSLFGTPGINVKPSSISVRTNPDQHGFATSISARMNPTQPEFVTPVPVRMTTGMGSYPQTSQGVLVQVTPSGAERIFHRMNQGSGLQAGVSTRHQKFNIAGARSSELSGDDLVKPGHSIRGTDGDEEMLDPRYKKRKYPANFFHVGRVFAILWHETGDLSKQEMSNDQATFSTTGKFGERIFSHIRRLVVVRERRGYCWCIPIKTYGGRGVNQNLTAEEAETHAIIHDVSLRPQYLPTEPRMAKTPIAADLDEGQNLDPLSRLNFAEVFRVEHNVKVMSIGQVSRKSIPHLESYWRVNAAKP